MKFVFRSIIYLFFSLAAICLLITAVLWLSLNMLLQDEPLLTEFEKASLEDLQRIKMLASRASMAYTSESEQSMDLTDRDINLGISYFGPTQITIPESTYLKTRIVQSEGTISATVPVQLIHEQVDTQKLIDKKWQISLWNMLKNSTQDKWINAEWRLTIDDSDEKSKWIKPGKLRIGSIVLTKAISDRIAQTAYAEFLNQKQSQIALDTWENISGLRLENDLLKITYRLPSSNQVLSSYQSLVLSADEQENIAHYSKVLERLPESGPLHSILAPMFSEAVERSNNSLNPVAENRAVLLALSKAYGGDQLLQMFGEATFEQFQSPAPYSIYKRRDLAQHYILSAGLTLIADESIASLIGVDKEITDLTRGRTISAWDLLADKAGARLAQNATNTAQSARQVQVALSNARTDGDLLPNIADEFEFSNDRFSLDELDDLDVLIELYLEQHPLLRK